MYSCVCVYIVYIHICIHTIHVHATSLETMDAYQHASCSCLWAVNTRSGSYSRWSQPVLKVGALIIGLRLWGNRGQRRTISGQHFKKNQTPIVQNPAGLRRLFRGLGLETLVRYCAFGGCSCVGSRLANDAVQGSPKPSTLGHKRLRIEGRRDEADYFENKTSRVGDHEH